MKSTRDVDYELQKDLKSVRFDPMFARNAPRIETFMRIFALCLLASAASAADYDLIIRNARVIDGTGNPWYRGDVGVRDGKIAAIGDLSRESANRMIDAKQRALAPGFIDVHTHVEGSVVKVPGGDNY